MFDDDIVSSWPRLHRNAAASTVGRGGLDCGDVVFKPIEARRLAESGLSMLRGRRVLIGET
jgi:hypothetical protein